MAELRDRAAGALFGLAIGDALGMPTEGLPRAEVRRRWGWLTGYEPAPDDQPIARGLPAGSVTDDTEQALIVARLLLAGAGHVDAHALADELTAWEERMRARGSLDLLGPSTRRALESVKAGEPVSQTGRLGSTNGAAMRIAPVGVATPLEPLAGLVQRVVEASAVTHSTGVALAGAAAVAAAVSAGVGGSCVHDAVLAGRRAAEAAAQRGHWVAAADVGARIGWATDLVRGRAPTDAADDVVRLVGTSLATQESVPAAFAVVAAHPADPWHGCLFAASLGGDADTIAAMAGAILGACHGASAFPVAAREVVEAVNDLDLVAVADDLLTLRGRTG
ncbi:MAG TPA: ADP-ribosylglycohydrolase family protein [Nocardioidaceae bacterium]|nr:ADP-ribosylglycohydrolase family protein [Nocardioidaceae bacterium]